MKQLKDLLYRVSIEAVKGTTDISVNLPDFDSRKIGPDDAFVAIRGTVSDGHDFIEKAINQGATAIICEKFPDVIVSGITYVQVRD
ncbi:MAG: UDP-N-acetylmuramoyl-L-alanyl-D-glutamate--2,6-diaminopimelate ligase, partial [Chitinophagaceae bacterium]